MNLMYNIYCKLILYPTLYKKKIGEIYIGDKGNTYVFR